MGKDSFGLLRSLMALLWGRQGLIRTLVGRVIFQHLGRGGRILDFKGITWFLGEQRGNQSSPTEYKGGYRKLTANQLPTIEGERVIIRILQSLSRKRGGGGIAVA